MYANELKGLETEHGSSTLFAGNPVQIKPEGSPSSAGTGEYGEDTDEQP
jgi:hypothetical protein